MLLPLMKIIFQFGGIELGKNKCTSYVLFMALKINKLLN